MQPQLRAQTSEEPSTVTMKVQPRLRQRKPATLTFNESTKLPFKSNQRMANLTKDVSACSALQRADRAERF